MLGQIPEAAVWAIFFLPLLSMVTIVFLPRSMFHFAGHVAATAIGVAFLLSLWALDSSIQADGLRLNYPVEAATMSSFRQSPGGPLEPNLGFPNLADDQQVQSEAGTFAPAGELIAPDRQFGPYTGQYSLGRQLAFAQEVRPFRRVISAQAIYRREVFE